MGAENIKVIKAEQMNPHYDPKKPHNGGGYNQPELMVRFDFDGAGYIAYFLDCSMGEFGTEQYTALYSEDEYLTCKHDDTVPDKLYEQWIQEGDKVLESGERGKITEDLVIAMDKALEVAYESLNII